MIDGYRIDWLFYLCDIYFLGEIVVDEKVYFLGFFVNLFFCE